MKFLLLGLCLCTISLEGNVFAQNHESNLVINVLPKRLKRQTEQEDTFLNKLTGIALKEIEGLSDYGHKLIEVEEIGNVSRTNVQNKIKVWACRFNDLNQKKKINKHPEQNVTLIDFFICDVCTIKINSTENNTHYRAVEIGCVLHDSRVLDYAQKSLIPGGYQQIDPNDEYVKQLAIFSLDSITQQTLSKRSLGFVKVNTAKSQVVAGMNYKINQLVCEKYDSAQKDNIIIDNKNCRSCEITIWEQAWLNNKNVTKVACSELSTLDSLLSVARTKRDIHENVYLKTKINLSFDDKKVQDIVKYALLSVDEQEGSIKTHMLSKIINASKQILSKILYSIELEICENSTSIFGERKCRICIANVWEETWESKQNTSKINCNEPYKMNVDLLNHEKVNTKKYSFNDRYQLKADFEIFINTHNKMYSSLEEKNKRFHIFAANMKRVKLLQDNEQGTAIYGATQFADLTKNEFKNKFLGLNPSLMSNEKLPMAKIPHIVSIPDEFDWRDQNAVTPVKNQGSCGSCWAFSAIANIEGQYALKSGKLLSLSEQELIDCDSLDNGCGGGLMTQAFKSVESLGGLETETKYPYEGHEDRKGCKFDKNEIKVSISKAVNISTNEDDIAKVLVTLGPLSVGVNANAMQFYMGGVSHPIHALCNPKSLDHGVAIVGYGVHRTKYTHKNLPYWLIKNSWGPGWGEKGYYLLYRGDGSCGVNQMVSSAIIE